MKHFTIIEQGGDSDSPMIATIDNVTNNPQGLISFKDRLFKALEAHYDADQIALLEPVPDLFAGSPYEDFRIETYLGEQTIRILETWIY